MSLNGSGIMVLVRFFPITSSGSKPNISCADELKVIILPALSAMMMALREEDKITSSCLAKRLLSWLRLSVSM